MISCWEDDTAGRHGHYAFYVTSSELVRDITMLPRYWCASSLASACCLDRVKTMCVLEACRGKWASTLTSEDGAAMHRSRCPRRSASGEPVNDSHVVAAIQALHMSTCTV